jgi:hypothetical protein
LDFSEKVGHASLYINQGVFMSKEQVKHRKDEKKKATLTPKEKKAKKQEKKQNKSGKI